MGGLGNKGIMSKNLKYYLSRSGKERARVCDDLEFSYSTFTDWKNGKKYPRIDKIEMLAAYFGVEKCDLIEDRDKYSTHDENIMKEKLRKYEKYERLIEALEATDPAKIAELEERIETYSKLFPPQENAPALKGEKS